MRRILGNLWRKKMVPAVLLLAGSCGVGTAPASAQSEHASICFCNANDTIGISQLIGAVNIALGRAPCPGTPSATRLQGAAGVEGVCFCDAGGAIGISQLIRAVNVALGKLDCPPPAATPTGAPVDTATPTLTTPPETPTAAPVDTATATPSPSRTATLSDTATATPTVAQGDTATPSQTATPSGTATPTGTSADTATPSDTPIRDACENKADGTTCDAGVDGMVRTCENQACGPCVALTSPDPRFVDNSDGTVTDRRTCLVWEKKTGTVSNFVFCATLGNCPDPHRADNAYTWSSGTEFNGTAKRLFLDVLNDEAGGQANCFAAHCDWRLPSQQGRNAPFMGPTELEDLLLMPAPCSVEGPCVDTIFGPTVESTYFSSSTLAGGPAVVWSVNFDNGALLAKQKMSFGFVRAVRGGP